MQCRQHCGSSRRSSGRLYCRETYQAGLASIVHGIHAQPFSKIWVNGDTSSSDGGFSAPAGMKKETLYFNVKSGSEPGAKFYAHISDRYAPFHSKVIAANASEAAHEFSTG